MIDSIQHAINYVVGRTQRVMKLRDSVEELTKNRKELRESVSKLGQDVWNMVETGDPLRALVHGARGAQFAQEIKDETEKT